MSASVSWILEKPAKKKDTKRCPIVVLCEVVNNYELNPHFSINKNPQKKKKDTIWCPLLLCSRQDLNLRPTPYHGVALPAELQELNDSEES